MKGGGIIEQVLQKASLENIKRRWPAPSRDNPYEGPQALGWDAYHAGVERMDNPWRSGMGSFGKGRRWDMGWIKAKLAKEQNKRSL